MTTDIKTYSNLTWCKKEDRIYCRLHPFVVNIYESNNTLTEYAAQIKIEVNKASYVLHRIKSEDIEALKQKVSEILTLMKNVWVTEYIQEQARIYVRNKEILTDEK